MQKNFNLAWRNTSNNQKNLLVQNIRAGKAQLIKKIIERSNLIKHMSVVIRLSSVIIENKIPNVVIGTVDSNIKVAGKGIKRLREAGANVIVGVLEDECYELNQRFFTFHEKKTA